MTRLLWLATMWVLLWGNLSFANSASGLAVAYAVMSLSRGKRAGYVAIRPLRALHFLAYFAYKLAESTAVVAWEVVTPRNVLHRGIVAIPLGHCSDGLATLIANVISLTPGTLTLEITNDPTTLYVHVLHFDDADAVRRRIHRLEVLAVRAFGTKEAIAAATIDDSRTLEPTR